MNCWLLPLPAWVTAVYLPTALLGLATWRSALGQSCLLLTGLYCVLFLVIGQPFNQYWGLLLAPPLAWGAARGPVALRDLVRASFRAGRVCGALTEEGRLIASPEFPVPSVQALQAANAE
jgi:hypothetical protein